MQENLCCNQAIMQDLKKETHKTDATGLEEKNQNYIHSIFKLNYREILLDTFSNCIEFFKKKQLEQKTRAIKS